MLFFKTTLLTNFNDSYKLDTSFQFFWYRYLYLNIFTSLGAHIGHSYTNTLRQSAWMIYGYKWNIAIINLVFTLFSIKAAFILTTACLRHNKPFWFVTQDKAFHRYSRYLALKCGEFSSTLFWIRGMLSNFNSITANFFTKKSSFIFMRKDYLNNLVLAEWFFTRLTFPGGLLISSIFASSFAVKDSLKSYVGAIGVLDTNAKANDSVFVVPANDDSIDWVIFLNDIFSEYILFKKLGIVLKWFYFLKKKSSFQSTFEKWITSGFTKSLDYDKAFFLKNFNNFSLYFFPLWFISSFNNNFLQGADSFSIKFKNLDIKVSKNILKNVFSNLLLIKKILISGNIVSSFTKPLFFMNAFTTFFLGESNLEYMLPYRFNYFFGNNWSLNKKFSSFFAKYRRKIIKFIGYIHNISFLLTFNFRNLFQKVSLIFRNFYNKNIFREDLFIFNKYSFFLYWFFRLKKKKEIMFLNLFP